MATTPAPKPSPQEGEEKDVKSAREPADMTRRKLLVGTAAVALTAITAPTDAPRAAEPDAELVGLARTFQQALDAYEAARQHYNRCEDRYFDLRPCVPEALTSDGPLGHLLFDPLLTFNGSRTVVARSVRPEFPSQREPPNKAEPFAA